MKITNLQYQECHKGGICEYGDHVSPILCLYNKDINEIGTYENIVHLGPYINKIFDYGSQCDISNTKCKNMSTSNNRFSYRYLGYRVKDLFPIKQFNQLYDSPTYSVNKYKKNHKYNNKTVFIERLPTFNKNTMGFKIGENKGDIEVIGDKQNIYLALTNKESTIGYFKVINKINNTNDKQIYTVKSKNKYYNKKKIKNKDSMKKPFINLNKQYKVRIKKGFYLNESDKEKLDIIFKQFKDIPLSKQQLIEKITRRIEQNFNKDKQNLILSSQEVTNFINL